MNLHFNRPLVFAALLGAPLSIFAQDEENTLPAAGEERIIPQWQKTYENLKVGRKKYDKNKFVEEMYFKG